MYGKFDFDTFNKVDLQKKKEMVFSLGIYELRALARELGIKSPTTKVRDVLIDNIVETLAQGKPTDPQISKKGRPFKKLANMENILSFISNKKDIGDDLMVFNQDIPDFKVKGGELFNVQGVLRIAQQTAYFLDLKTSEEVFLNQDFVDNKKLVNGDFIQGKAYVINSKKQYLIETVDKINFKDSKEYVPLQNAHLPQVLPSEFLHAENLKLLRGGRNYYVNKEPIFLDNKLKKVFSTISADDAVNVFLGLNLCFEDKMYVASLNNFVCFYTDYLSENSNCFDKILDSYNLANRLSMQCVNINFIIYDAGLVLTQLEQKFNILNKDNPYYEAEQFFKKIISLAVSKNNNISTTLFLTIKDSDLQNNIIKNDLIRISIDVSI